MNSKKILRQKYLNDWRGISLNKYHEYSNLACQIIYRAKWFINANNILVYSPILGEEIDILYPLLKNQVAIETIAGIGNKKIYLPNIVNNQLEFNLCDQNTKYIKNIYGISEPDSNNNWQYNNHEHNLIIVPCLAAAKNGIRLGRGKGFYDKYLTNLAKPNIYKIVILPEQFICDNLPFDNWDIKIDSIVSLGDNYAKIYNCLNNLTN